MMAIYPNIYSLSSGKRVNVFHFAWRIRACVQKNRMEMNKMRTGILSDASIKRNCAAFFAADFDTHERTLSGFPERITAKHNLNGLKHFPRRIAKPRTPVSMMLDASGGGGGGGGGGSGGGGGGNVQNLVKTYHGVQKNEVKTESKAESSSTNTKTPTKSLKLQRLAASFFGENPDYANVGVTPRAAAFLEVINKDSQLKFDPKLITGHQTTRFGEKVQFGRIDGVLMSALKLAKKDEDVRDRLQEAYKEIMELSDD